MTYYIKSQALVKKITDTFKDTSYLDNNTIKRSPFNIYLFIIIIIR